MTGRGALALLVVLVCAASADLSSFVARFDLSKSHVGVAFDVVHGRPAQQRIFAAAEASADPLAHDVSYEVTPLVSVRALHEVASRSAVSAPLSHRSPLALPRRTPIARTWTWFLACTRRPRRCNTCPAAETLPCIGPRVRRSFCTSSYSARAHWTSASRLPWTRCPTLLRRATACGSTSFGGYEGDWEELRGG